MFSVGIHDSAAECLLRAAGRLEGEAVRELEMCWRTASSTTARRGLRVDVGRVESMDAAGEALIAGMLREGVAVTREAPAAPASRFPAPLRAVARLAALGLLLAFPPAV